MQKHEQELSALPNEALVQKLIACEKSLDAAMGVHLLTLKSISVGMEIGIPIAMIMKSIAPVLLERNKWMEKIDNEFGFDKVRQQKFLGGRLTEKEMIAVTRAAHDKEMEREDR
jgi:hypothetical protein